MDQLDTLDERKYPGDCVGAGSQLLMHASIEWSQNFRLEFLDVVLAQLTFEPAAAVKHQLAPGEPLAILVDQTLNDLTATFCRLQEWRHSLLFECRGARLLVDGGEHPPIAEERPGQQEEKKNTEYDATAKDGEIPKQPPTDRPAGTSGKILVALQDDGEQIVQEVGLGARR